jgi:uncharacterized protein (DUF1810 family)
VLAQEAGGTYSRAIGELRGGHKVTHWIWFVFPQIAGLGQSETSRRYSIFSLEEARAYLEHPVLGPRLLECARILCDLHGPAAEEIFGSLDAQKVRSSMTLFVRARPEEAIFAAVLERYFDGSADPLTDELLGASYG